MAGSNMKKIKLSTDATSNSSVSGRKFQDSWIEYGMIEQNRKAFCVLCSESVVCRTSSVKRHFDTNHAWLQAKSKEEQKEYISREMKAKQMQSSNFAKFVKSSSNVVAASLEVSKIIAQHGKPLSDGDYIKECWIACAPHLFEDFPNKEKIMQRIKDMPLSRNTVKERVSKLHSNVELQLKNDLSATETFSICLDESTDVSSSARLAIIARFARGDEIREELVTLANLPGKTTGADICKSVVEELSAKEINISKIVSVTTDGAPSMTGKEVGFVRLFTEEVGHPLLSFHCIIHQEALCAKTGLKEIENVMAIVTRIVNFISARALNKRQFQLLLDEVESVYSGLLMYNSVRWLSRGRVLERFVCCLEEIRLFLDSSEQQFAELTDIDWLNKLMFFADFTLHLNELNVKLQGTGKTIDVMFDIIKSFEMKLRIYKRDIEQKEFKYFKHLKTHYNNMDISEKVGFETYKTLYLEIIDATIKQFSTRFEQFKKFDETSRFIKYPDTALFENLNLEIFNWLDITDFEMQLVELQTSTIWKQKFVDLRMKLEEIERDRLMQGATQVSAENEILTVWNNLPDIFNNLKSVAGAILSIFSSSYSCEALFSSMNFIKSDLRNRLTDDMSAACVALKNTKYEPDIKKLSCTIQQQKSH